MSTPHINAKPEDFAKTVLMPGDPLRSKFIAENFLESPRLVNNVRGIQGYTGQYKGNKISVMASGMGMPSMAIYSYELFSMFGVENIIRIGTAGSLQEYVNVRDIVIGMGACTNSAYAAQYAINGTFAPIADYYLLRTCADKAEELGIDVKIGNLVSSDVFYHEAGRGNTDKWKKMGVLATEMEAAALYMNALRLSRRALAICTVADSMLNSDTTDALERERSFTQMMTLALETAIEL